VEARGIPFYSLVTIKELFALEGSQP